MKLLKFLGISLVIVTSLAVFLLYESDVPTGVIDAKYTSPASQFLDLGAEGLIHYRDEGSRRNDVVVLLHGSNASLHTWEPWVRRLIDRYRVISLDFPAHGLTGAVESGRYSTASYVEVIEQLMEHLDIKHFVLGGNSMGGRIAWQYTLENPDQVDALVLVAASGLAAWRETRPDDAGNGVLAFSLLGKPWFRFFAAKLDPYYLIEQGLASAYNHSDVVNDELIMRYYDLHLREGTRAATLARFGQRRKSGNPDLSEITAPTLLMWGKADPLISMATARQFEAAIPNTTTAYYENVGHIPMEEIPDRSANDLRAFLDSLDPDEPDEIVPDNAVPADTGAVDTGPDRP